MKIYFVLQKYYPDITASGNLIMELVKVMSEKERVEVLCTSDNSSENQFENYTIKKFKTDPHRANFFERITGRKTIINDDMEDYLTKEISNDKDKIVLIPITISEIKLAIKLKKQNPQIILFPLLLEIIPTQYAEANQIKNELELYSDTLVVLPKLKNYFTNSKNLLIVEHPMVINNVGELNQNNEVNVTHIGGLDRRNRNPRKIIDVIEKLKCSRTDNQKNIVFNFYGYGNMDNYLKNKSKEMLNFNYFGLIDSKDSKKVLSESSILITIGNKNSDLVPSKLFDYISTGNPIIHFFQNKNDPYVTYLMNYKYSICIDYNNIDVQDVFTFINNNQEKKLSYDQIIADYNEFTPEYVGKQILNQVGNL